MREMSSITYSRYFGTLPSITIQLANKNQLKTFFRIISRIGIGYPGYVSQRNTQTYNYSLLKINK